MVGGCHMGNKYHLEPMARWMVQLDVKGSEEAIQDGSADEDCFNSWNKQMVESV